MPAQPEHLHIQAHRAQLDFMNERSVPFVGFVGGRGSGKSTALAMRLLKWSVAEPGPYGCYAPTFPLLSDTIQKTFLELARPFIKEFNQSKNIIYMKGGSDIICRSLDDPEHARGPNLRGAVWDEMSLCKQEAFDILIACLRWRGEKGWLSSGFTPRGLNHWSAVLFNDPSRPDVKCFHSTTMDNPFTPEGFAETLRRQYTKAFAAQEIEGGFVSLGGALMRREWFKIVEAIPPLRSVIRYWDMAATLSNGNNDPDWTAGAKLGRTVDGRWIVLDMRHARLSPAGNEMLVQHTASEDGKQVKIGMEEEGGASGKSLIDHYRRAILVGYNFHSMRPTGDKVVRAMPLAAAAEAGNVMVLKGDWNKDFLDECESFSADCPHDDQVDAASGAVNMLFPKFINPHAGSSPRAEESVGQDINAFQDILAQAKTPAEREELLRIINGTGTDNSRIPEGAVA
jgi:predicted phage terminase large subunit-like protein